MFAETGSGQGQQNYQEFKETQYDKLAETLREYLDMDAVYRMMGM